MRGLGSAHSGSHHWLVQRFTAIGNLVLGLWFMGAALLAAALTTADDEQTEEAIASRRKQRVFPAARPLVGRLARRERRFA